MSHFTVAVFIPSAEVADPAQLPDAILARLAPYQENNMGTCPSEYMEFNDQEDELRKEYETEGYDRVVLADGTVDGCTWDEKYKSEACRAAKAGDPLMMRDGHRELEQERCYPDGSEVREVPYSKMYETFQVFAADHHGHDAPDEKTGRYGYWENPQAKWDFFTLGGRWSDHFPVTDAGMHFKGERSWGMEDVPVKSGTADATQVKAVDWRRVSADTQQRIDEKYGAWCRYRDSPADNEDPFYGIRDTAMSLGLVSCKNRSELTADEQDPGKFRLAPWSEGRWLSAGNPRYDVLDLTPFSAAEWDASFRNYFHSLRPFAFLDPEGWHASGEMGWWGNSSCTPESSKGNSRNFTDTLSRWREVDPEGWVALVDCHI